VSQVRRRRDMSSRAWSYVPIGIAVVTGSLLAADPAAAQAQSQKLKVQARIGELCTVTSASLDFGQSLNLNVNTDAAGTIAITCASQTALNVRLDGGLSGDFNGRNMKNGGNFIRYSLYRDSARQQLWDAGQQVPATINGSGSVPVYGRVPSQTNGHPSGVYTDDVTITLVF
jgi:spore coat protein U-like protein